MKPVVWYIYLHEATIKEVAATTWISTTEVFTLWQLLLTVLYSYLLEYLKNLTPLEYFKRTDFDFMLIFY